jgi:hypothetical protein
MRSGLRHDREPRRTLQALPLGRRVPVVTRSSSLVEEGADRRDVGREVNIVGRRVDSILFNEAAGQVPATK